jgi:HK97 family phage prohead protease
MTTNERRFLSRIPRLETRADGKPVIAGYGAVFYNPDDPGTQYRLWGNTYERFMPGAFDEALKSDDVRSFFNHDPSAILGRKSAGTLKLSVDEVGLRYEVTPPDTQYAKDLLQSIERGDVSGASIIFDLPGDRSRVVWIEEGETEIREIQACKLYEVGPV